MGLGGQGAPVKLQVELAGPDRQPVARETGEELLDVGHPEPRKRREIVDSRVVLQHPSRRSAAAVAPAEGKEALGVVMLAAEVVPRSEGVERGDVAVVAVGRGQVAKHVRRHPAAVQPLPREQVVGEEVLLVPGQLDREETPDTGAAQQLRDAAGEAEDVREPGDRRPRAEPPLEGALTVEELADERLTAGDLAVRLHPGAANRLPAAFRHPLPDAGEEVRRILLDPGVELGRGLVEGEVRVAVHQVEHGGKGPAPLAPRLGDGPQPREIDVGVARERQAPNRRVVAPQLVEPPDELGTSGLDRLERRFRQRLQRAGRWWEVPDGRRVRMDFVRLNRVARRDGVDAAANWVHVPERQPGERHVARGRPSGSEYGEGGVGGVEQERGDLVLAELLRGLEEHRQVPLQAAQLGVGHDEVSPLQTGLGDVAAEHPLRHHLRLDGDALAAPRRVGDAEAVVKGVESGLEPSREADEPFAAEPEFQLDRPTCPRIGDGRGGREADRRLDDRPEVPELNRPGLAVARGEGPVRDWMLPRVAPGADLFQPPGEPLEATGFRGARHEQTPPAWIRTRPPSAVGSRPTDRRPIPARAAVVQRPRTRPEKSGFRPRFPILPQELSPRLSAADGARPRVHPLT